MFILDMKRFKLELIWRSWEYWELKELFDHDKTGNKWSPNWIGINIYTYILEWADEKGDDVNAIMSTFISVISQWLLIWEVPAV